jgi:hypothetical protein
MRRRDRSSPIYTQRKNRGPYGQKVTDTKKECLIIQNRCEAGVAIPNDMEMKLEKKELEMKELQTDLSKVRYNLREK